jgi:flagellin
MATDKMSLSEAVRGNLLTLQRTARAMRVTQTHLSTGLKVNSAVDGAAAFFMARGLNNKALDLDSLKSNVNLAISTIQAAIDGIDAITKLVGQAKGLASNAKATGDTNERSTLAVQFNALLAQIDNIANDSTFNGINLLKETPDSLDVVFNENNTSNLTITGLDSTTKATGINLGVATNFFADNVAIEAALTNVGASLTTLRSNAATLGSNITVLRKRLDFTQNLVNTLEAGSAKLTLADLNEESSNLLALQTRQQLGLNSLSLAAQSERAILSLFG